MARNYYTGKRFSPERLIPIGLIILVFISWIAWANLANPFPRSYPYDNFELGTRKTNEIDDLKLRKHTIIEISVKEGNAQNMYLVVMRDGDLPVDSVNDLEFGGIWSSIIRDQFARIEIGDTDLVQIYIFRTFTTDGITLDFDLTIDEPPFAETDEFGVLLFISSMAMFVLVLSNYKQFKYGYMALKAKILGKKFINEGIEIPEESNEINDPNSFDEAFDKAFK